MTTTTTTTTTDGERWGMSYIYISVLLQHRFIVRVLIKGETGDVRPLSDSRLESSVRAT